MKNIKLLSLLLLASLSLVGCDPNDSETTYNPNPTTNFSENFGPSVTRDFIGQVVDLSGQPIASASVKIGTSTAQTDVNGVFILNGAGVNENFAYITATKAGYIDGSRALVPTVGKNIIKIMLLPTEPIATIPSGESSTVTYGGGTQVVFDGAFADENGNAYSGSVNVSMYHLNPSNQNLRDIMPGMLYAQNAQGQERALETYGMLHVELRGSGGQKLQIASGHTAEISVAIDATQMATAPATIPLWHFDEANGYWKEDGVATRQGNKYVGSVSHFSWWNCDAQFPTIELSLTVLDENGNPLPGIYVSLVRAGQSGGAGAMSDSEGHISGLVPANETLTMNAYFYNVCGDQILTSQTIGPFTTDATLPDLVIDSPDVNSVSIEGNLVKCDNTNVTNGYVLFKNQFAGAAFAPVTNGSFGFQTIVCDNAPATQFALKGVDYDNLQQTDSIYFNYTIPVTNVGNIMACNTIDEFVTYQLDSDAPVYLVASVGGGFQGSNFSIYAGNEQQNGIYIGGQTTVPGVFTTADNFVIEGSVGYIWSGSSNTMVFTVSNIGDVGGFIDLTFNGTFTDDTGVHTLNGTAHVKRNN